MQEAWKTATLCSTKGLLTQKAGESKEKDRNGKINWHPSTTAAGIQQKWGKFHFRGIHRGARNGTTTTAFRNKQWQKEKKKKKRQNGTLTHTQDTHTQHLTVLPNILIQNGRVWGTWMCNTNKAKKNWMAQIYIPVLAHATHEVWMKGTTWTEE